MVIGVCLIAVAIIWWRTREWRWAVVPLIAISLQATIFLFLTLVVGRQRPPAIPMDASPPTSSYPSGHTGASTALYFSLLLMAAARIERPWLRRLLMTLCAVVPFLVGIARLYRGAHHISDVRGRHAQRRRLRRAGLPVVPPPVPRGGPLSARAVS